MSNVLADMLTKGVFTEDEGLDLTKRLLLLYHLSVLQENICKDVERIFNKKGIYGFSIKHNHETVKRKVRTCYGDFMRDFSERQTDIFCDNADSLERVVNKWAGINDRIL